MFADSTSTLAIAYTVAVRSLCEFTAKHGDLDRRFTPSATALEGQMGQAAVQARRGPAYESEISLEGQVGSLLVRGRADGYDAADNRLEEIKTLRGPPEALPENRRHLHWAQLQTYGALLCASRQLQEVHLALVYVDAATLHETVLRQLCSAEALQLQLLQRCQQFSAWAQREAGHRQQRDQALKALPFPLGEFRGGQREMAEAVYRHAVRGRCLLAQAPTGIGKTMGALFPMLRAMPVAGLDKLAYLTCKGTGRITALDGLQRLRTAAPQAGLRVLVMVAKEQACEYPDKACHGDACPLARGFYDRLPLARLEAVDAGWMDAAALRRVALQHGICPYYLGQELLRWADVLVGDVHHYFDPHGQLHGLTLAQEWRLGLLVDEAHNLVERTRQMYSAALALGQVRSAAQTSPPSLRGPLAMLASALEAVVAVAEGEYAALDEVPDSVVEALRDVLQTWADYLQQQPLAAGAMLETYFELLRFARALDRLGSHSLLDVQRMAVTNPALPTVPLRRSLPPVADLFAATDGPRLEAAGPTESVGDSAHPELEDDDLGWSAHRAEDAVLTLRNVVPGPLIKPRFELCHCAVLFSATLAPQSYQRDLLGLPEGTGWVDVPPLFAPENLQVAVARHLSTRYLHRQASLQALVRLMARQFQAHPGNYLAFFSSFSYLQQAADALMREHPDVPQWRQGRYMDEGARLDFLQRFVPDGRGIAFAVLGGAFAEGVDLPGSRLIGAFVATLGLPPVSPVQDQYRQRLDTHFGPGHGYADLVPGMHKVVQAAGRVLRTPQDSGWLWLMDQRYAQAEVRALLPTWWQIPNTASDTA